MSARAADASARWPSGAMPGEVLEQLVSLIICEIGEERRSDRAGGIRTGLARYAIAAQAHQLGVRHRERLAQLVKDVRRGAFDNVVFELAQIGG